MKYSTEQLQRLDRQYVWHPFTQMKDWLAEPPLVIESGEGAVLRDTDGNEYIDGVSSLWCNVHGHRRPEIDQAIRGQLDRIAHSTMLGLANVPATLLAEKLVRIAPEGLTRVFYSDDGSTANEIALKLAYQYCQQTGGTGKTKFISLPEAYHGDTIGSVSVGGIDLFHAVYRPLLFERIPAPPPTGGIEPLREIVEQRDSEIAGIIVEPLMQGAGGMIEMPKGYLADLRELCTQHDILMIADEVAVGFGRTGRMFACEHENVTPDLMALAKGLSGGYLPLAATLTTERIFEGFLGDYGETKTFFHGHTYTGNPLACAAALASLEIFERERTLEKLAPKINLLAQQLERFKRLPHVGEVSQCGFMVGIRLVRDKTTMEHYDWTERHGARVCELTRRHGVIIRPLGDVIVLMPPLCITAEQLTTLPGVVYRCIKEVTEQ